VIGLAQRRGQRQATLLLALRGPQRQQFLGGTRDVDKPT